MKLSICDNLKKDLKISLDLYTYLCYTKFIIKKAGDYMPEICRFKGIIIKMIFQDNDKHHKPHVHVYYGEYEASMSLDGELLEGKLPLKQYRMVSGWMALHEDELYKAWNNAVRGKAFNKVEPLR